MAVPAAQRVRGCLVWPWRIASVRGRGFDCSGLRVAHWVADACLRASFCVDPRCSLSVSLLVTPYSCWSVEVPGLTGMQEVSGSARLAPLVRILIRTGRTGSTAGKSSNGGPLGPLYVCSDGACYAARAAGMAVGSGRWRCSACHLGKSLPDRSRDSLLPGRPQALLEDDSWP